MTHFRSEEPEFVEDICAKIYQYGHFFMLVFTVDLFLYSKMIKTAVRS